MAKKKSSVKTASANKSSASTETPRFEDSLAKLELVVTDLESGNLPLSESIQRYEEGVKLLKQCHQSLDSVQRKIELLTKVDQDGQATTEPFNDLETPATRPGRRKSTPESVTSTGEGDDSGDELAPDVDEDGRLF